MAHTIERTPAPPTAPSLRLLKFESSRQQGDTQDPTGPLVRKLKRLVTALPTAYAAIDNIVDRLLESEGM